MRNTKIEINTVRINLSKTDREEIEVSIRSTNSILTGPAAFLFLLFLVTKIMKVVERASSHHERTGKKSPISFYSSLNLLIFGLLLYALSHSRCPFSLLPIIFFSRLFTSTSSSSAICNHHQTPYSFIYEYYILYEYKYIYKYNLRMGENVVHYLL